MNWSVVLLALLLLLVFATWRISYLLTKETGPGRIFRRLRDWAGVEHEGQHHGSLLAQILSCMSCTSVWMGSIQAAIALLFVFLIWREPLLLVLWPFVTLALSGGAMVIHRVDETLEQFRNAQKMQEQYFKLQCEELQMIDYTGEVVPGMEIEHER